MVIANKADAMVVIGELTQELTALRAENERLREALREVLDNALDDYYAENDPAFIISRARAALEGDE